MPQMIFVNLPVKDLERSKAFFSALGYTFNAQFTDENAASMVISDNIFAMLITEKYFSTFTSKPISNAKQSTEVLVALNAESPSEVRRIVETAHKAGAGKHKDAVDHGFMYQWGFEDLDGHIWEYFWMNPEHVQK